MAPRLRTPRLTRRGHERAWTKSCDCIIRSLWTRMNVSPPERTQPVPYQHPRWHTIFSECDTRYPNPSNSVVNGTTHQRVPTFPCFLLIPSNFLNKDSCNFLLPPQACCIFCIRIQAMTVNPTVFSECFLSRKEMSGVMPISSRSFRSALLL